MSKRTPDPAKAVRLTDLPARVQALVRQVAAAEDVAPEVLLGDSRIHAHALARHRLWHVLHHTPAPSGACPSLSQIGLWFRRDHTSIRHGVLRWEDHLRELEAAGKAPAPLPAAA